MTTQTKVSRLNQYKGRLTSAQIAEGMRAAQSNATRLVEDAKLLLQSDRWASAASLAILSIEESGKIGILRRMVGKVTDETIREAWRDYRSHTAKNYPALLPELVRKGARQLDDLESLFTSESADERLQIDQLKQIAFYTDCLGNAHWSQPVHVIPKSLAESLVRIAEVIHPGTSASEASLELWAKHMTPLAAGKLAANNQLIRWANSMQEAGLMSRADCDEFVRFVGDIGSSKVPSRPN
jgi:AbiV family abortive infection protein